MIAKIAWPIVLLTMLAGTISATADSNSNSTDAEQTPLNSAPTPLPPMPTPLVANPSEEQLKKENDTERGIRILNEYSRVLTPEQFGEIIRIYGVQNESVSSLERERNAVDYMSRVLTDEQIAQMPVPLSFRRVNPEAQKAIKAIYFERNVPFDQKLFKIGLIIQQLPTVEREMFLHHNQNNSGEAFVPVNDRPNEGLIEFEVNVTTTYNGYFEKERIQTVLNDQERAELEKILNQTLSRHEKNHAIGQLLRGAYQRDPNANIDRWPGMFGTQTVLTNEQRHAVTHMLFSADPMADRGPFVAMLRQIIATEQKLKDKEQPPKQQEQKVPQQQQAEEAQKREQNETQSATVGKDRPSDEEKPSKQEKVQPEEAQKSQQGLNATQHATNDKERHSAEEKVNKQEKLQPEENQQPEQAQSTTQLTTVEAEPSEASTLVAVAAPSPQEQKQQNTTDSSTAAEKKGEDSTQQQQSLAVSERRVLRAIRFAGEVALHELN